MTIKSSGSLYEQVPKFKELCERVSFYEQMYPGSMAPALPAITTARKNLLLGRIAAADRRRFEKWAATTLRGIDASIARAEARKGKKLARAGRLN